MDVRAWKTCSKKIPHGLGPRAVSHFGSLFPSLLLILGIANGLLVPCLSFASTMSNLAASMAPGTFAEMTTTGFNNGALMVPPLGGTILEFADKGVWNPVAKEVLFYGGAHCGGGICPGADKLISFSDSTNAWTTLDNGGFGVGHSYQHNALDPATGRFYFRPFNSTEVKTYQGGWSSIPSIPVSSIQVAGGLTWFPEKNGLVFVDSDAGVWYYNKVSNSWSQLSSALSMGPYHNFAIYNPVHKVVLFGGGNASNAVWRLKSDNTITSMASSPVSIGVTASVTTIDPVSGNMVVLVNGSIRDFNPTTNTWTTKPGSAPFDPSNQVIAIPITDYGVIMLVTTTKVYLYRHLAGTGGSGGGGTADTTAPSVPTSVSASAQSSSVINVTWTGSSDNVGVTGYKIYRLGTFVTAVQATSFTDTGLTPSTTYTYTVSAIDAAGNESAQSSSTFAQTQPLAGSGSSSGDFATRCQAPGVVRCFGLDDQAVVAPHLFEAWDGVFRGKVVTDVKSSGAGSLRFDIPSIAPSNTSGSFWLNFADDLSVQFGQGQEFYVQWRQRFSPEFLVPVGPAGWKQIIIGEGDRPGTTVYSCTQLEVVMENDWVSKTSANSGPGMYHSCGGKDGNYDFLQRFDTKLGNVVSQNAVGCLYPNYDFPPCVGYKPNQWMTFQVHIKIGTWYINNSGNYHFDSSIQVWVAEEGKPSKIVFDWRPENGFGYDLANDNPAAKYGKLWLLPYTTSRTGAEATTAFPPAFTWYDDLIISTQRIPDPTPGAVLVAPMAPTGLQVR